MHDNKVTKNYGVNQFQSKRYPDEDATNPFEGQGGGTFGDFYGTFWDFMGHFGTFTFNPFFRAKGWAGNFGAFMGHFGTFTSNPFQGQGGGTLWKFYIHPFPGPMMWDILGLLHPTIFRVKEVGHFGTFKSNPLQDQGVGHFAIFTSDPFQGQGGLRWDILGLLHLTLFRAKEIFEYTSNPLEGLSGGTFRMFISTSNPVDGQ